LIGGWNLLNVSLGIIILNLKCIGGQIIFNFHWFFKDEEAMDVTTLALGSRPKQRLARLRTKRELWEAHCMLSGVPKSVRE
jgi:hypothetical protein